MTYKETIRILDNILINHFLDNILTAKEWEAIKNASDIMIKTYEFSTSMVTESAPSVTEFADKCRECGKALGYSLKQEPCEDAISRQAAIQVTTGMMRNTGTHEEYAQTVLSCLPSVTPMMEFDNSRNGAKMESKATSGEIYPGEFEAMEHNGRMDAVVIDHD